MTTSKTPFNKATFTLIFECKPTDSAYTLEYLCSAESDAGDFDDDFIDLLQRKIQLIICCQCSDFEADDKPIWKKLQTDG
jgi:hypothetical protein